MGADRLLLLLLACGGGPESPSGGDGGAGPSDGGGTDGGNTDGGNTDGGGTDGGNTDGGGTDGGGTDGGNTDGGTTDGGTVAARSCLLGSDLPDPWFWEGEAVVLQLRCAGELPVDEAVFSPIGLPEGAAFDPGTRTLTWTPDGDDAGTWDFNVSIVDPRAPSAVPEVGRVRIWVADQPDLDGGSAPDPLRYTEEWGLKVFHISAPARLSTSYVPSTVVFDGKRYDAQIKIRGASSAWYTKPGYTLEFDEDELDLGWGPDDRDHVLLISTFDDNSQVRQKLIYDQWAAIAAYWGEERLTPRTEFVVVYLNGAYQGLFLALDRIDNEFIRHMGFDAAGNLYKAVNHDANFYATTSSGSLKSSLAEGYTQEEGDATDFADLIAFVGYTSTASDAELATGLDGWARSDEFMDWFLLVTYSLSQDSGGKNSYLYHEPVLDRFLFSPWDFNASWGQSWYTTRTSHRTIDDFSWANRVFVALQNERSDELWERFRRMREDGPFARDWLLGKLDEYEALIEPSARRDEEAWRSAYRSYWWAAYRSDWTDWEGEMAYLREWIALRDAVYRERVP